MKNLKYCDFKNFILAHDASFEPRLSSVTEINTYIDKLYSNADIFFKTEDNNLVGFVAGYINDFINKSAYISLVLVDKHFRGKGIANSLLKEFTEECRRLNFKVIRLEARINNSAKRLYENFGFSEEFRDQFSIHFILKLN